MATRIFFLLLLVHAIIRQRETRNIVIETSVTDGRLSYGWTNHWSANYLVDDAIVACVGGVICSGTGRVRSGLLWLSGKGFQSRFGMSRGQSNHRDCSRACNNFKMCMRYVLKRHCSQFAYVALTVPRFLRWCWYRVPMEGGGGGWINMNEKWRPFWHPVIWRASEKPWVIIGNMLLLARRTK